MAAHHHGGGRKAGVKKSLYRVLSVPYFFPGLPKVFRWAGEVPGRFLRSD